MIQVILVVLGLVVAGVVYKVVSPEKQEVVKEGYSGTSSKVVATKNEFTGNNKAIVVSPEKPVILKEGFSKPYEANASGNAIPTPTPGQVPDAKPAATPMLVPDTKAKKEVQIIEKKIEKIDKELKALEKEMK